MTSARDTMGVAEGRPDVMGLAAVSAWAGGEGRGREGWAFPRSGCKMSTGEACWGMGVCPVSASREAQGCLVIQQVASFQLRSRALAERASKPAAASACCQRCQRQGNL